MSTALISVWSKDGIIDFAEELVDMGWDLLASGGTARTLMEAGLAVRDVESIVGGGSIFDHRVVTLSREVAEGLLAKDNEEDRAELERLDIPLIGLVCVDLYPLREAILRSDATEESILESTDIGGSTLLSAAAKGRRIVIGSPENRQPVLDWLREGKPDEAAFLQSLGATANRIVGEYSLLSACAHGEDTISHRLSHTSSECVLKERAA